MRFFYLACLGALFLLQIALVNLAQADWAACMEQPVSQWAAGLLLPGDALTALMFVLPALPLAALAVGVGRPDALAWIAAFILFAASLFFLLPSSDLHDCDRKGSDAPFAVIFLLPLSLLTASVALLVRNRIR